jgi:hypothetical protein
MMSLLHTLSRAIFTGNREWAWRRRGAISGGVTFLAGVIHSIWFDHDIAHASMVMTNCVTGFTAVIGVYTGAVVTDDHLKRRNTNITGET